MSATTWEELGATWTASPDWYGGAIFQTIDAALTGQGVLTASATVIGSVDNIGIWGIPIG